jgi:hypothetical protein
MSPPRQAYRGGTLVLSVLMVVVGLALLVATVARGGGPLAVGVMFGVLFVAAGGARLWLLRRS